MCVRFPCIPLQIQEIVSTSVDQHVNSDASSKLNLQVPGRLSVQVDKMTSDFISNRLLELQADRNKTCTNKI